jgi:5-methylcytosine-specific restriction endonuclease McrA
MQMQSVAAIHQHHSKGAALGKPELASRPAQSTTGGSALSASVLVLNRMYMAVRVINARRAFCLLYSEMAEVIHQEEGHYANFSFQTWQEYSGLHSELKKPLDDWIKTVGFEIQVPRVIRLLNYDRLPKQQVHLNRRNVLARDEHICQYCGRHYPTNQLSLDHIMPRSRGGATTWENVVCACLKCNIHKGGRTPQEARMKLVRKPTRPKRNPLIVMKLNNPKYESWRNWMEGVYWDLGSKE